MIFTTRDLDILRLLRWCRFSQADDLYAAFSKAEIHNLLSLRLIRYYMQGGAFVLTADGHSLLKTAFRDLPAANIKLRRLNAKYKEFSEESGLPEQRERLKVYKNEQKNIFTSSDSRRIMNAESGGGHVTINNIERPIEQRNTGKGNPNAILHFDVDLNNRQEKILDALPNFDSRIIISKNNVSMIDLAALTAKTGDEFALFTKSGERMVVRGNSAMVAITPEEARTLGEDGYNWSGHTHPGIDMNSLQPSSGDYAILNQFDQQQSLIYNSAGQYLVFERTEPYV